MSERPLPSQENGRPDGVLTGTETVPVHSFWWKTWLVLKVVQARLRFVAILVAIGAVIIYWPKLSAYYEKWTRPVFGEANAASADTEYWCPMHPAIVRDHPDKCPICGMPLSRRKKSEPSQDEPLPAGVVSRVQLTPYREAVAGIETTRVGYRRLTKDITAVGTVEFDETRRTRIVSQVTGRSRIDKLYVNVTGQTVRKGDPVALLYSPDLVTTTRDLLSGNANLERMARERLHNWEISNDQIDAIVRKGQPVTQLTIRSPVTGHVTRKYHVEGDWVEASDRLFDVDDLHMVWIEAQVYEDEIAFMREGLAVRATTRTFPNRVFAGKLTFIHPHLDAGTRTLRVRFDMDNPRHELRPGMYATVTAQVPATQLDLLPDDASAARKRSYERGLVLAVPERAVIDTGSRKLVYRESEPEVFDGVEVQLGPRCGGYYPVVRGLKAGDMVATEGSFLIDAETRLTAGAASTYFGAAGGVQSDRHAAVQARPSMTGDEDEKVERSLARLSPDDRKLAEAQGHCPVLGTRLGAMGKPVKVMLQGQPVLLCCKNCKGQATDQPDQTLAKTAKLTAETKARRAAPPGSADSAGKEDADIRANLAGLSPEDRRLAEAQKFCPISGERLGSMGKPVKVTVKDQPVFLCCKNCKDKALGDPDRTLAKVKALKAKAASPKK